MFRRTFLLSMPALVACSVAPQGLSLAPESTLILTRHADRQDNLDLLSDTGRDRARALVAATKDLIVTRIHAPGIDRNLATAAPLAKALDLPVERIPQEHPTAALVQSAQGRSVIWIGNKGNLTRIWEDLRLTGPAPLEYGDLAILRADANGTATIERRRYGPV
ncbi:histidine phosphatase family protein [Sagittula stellata]|uniref:Histidine phosphatase family protein n=1 Tax=Sagittula stellata (strain ATCC 700073 / DSM 11524 / E-37) TaxID=388399 RepID=A3K714_SAGS3|nr:histidine phosphatase family protein [Sagittula stellata]EBA07141.1 hypothetical protein SSE37_13126 [Sagittula stellata E-37]